MIDLIRNIFAGIFGYFFDLGEFLVGIGIGLLFAWIFVKLRPAREEISSWFQIRMAASRERRGRSSVDKYRADLIARASSMHIANALFSLDEIAVAPRLLAPPIPTDPDQTEPAPEDTLSVVPNLPDRKFLSGIYRAPTIELGSALKDGANILITGRPGSGKTTALAYLAIRSAMGDPEAGVAADLMPIFIHAADLILDRNAEKDPLKPIITAAVETTSSTASSRLPGKIKSQFSRGGALLLLDGLDEFPPNELTTVAAWLEKILEAYPKIRVVAAGPVRGYGGITKAGLTPVPIAPWSAHEHHRFLRNWGLAWQEHILPTLPKKRDSDVDPALYSGWLSDLVRGYTPLDVTLLTWSAYVGDVRGPKIVDCFESYVARFLSPNERKSAGATALNWIKGRSGIIADRAVKRGTPINDMIEAGILSRHVANRLTFSNPSVGAYLAAREMANSGISFEAAQLGWSPAESTMRYFSAMGDISAVADRYLEVRDDPLEEHLLAMSDWIREADGRPEWRARVLRELATIANAHSKPYGLRLRTIHALAYSNEMSVAVLFRRLLQSKYPSSRVLGALGLGGLRDEDSIDALIQTINERQNLHTRQAACLGLAGIGTESSLEGLGRLLLEGDETIRLSAGEALACDPNEGYSMLREAVEIDNLLTRRAAVFGLSRVSEDWAFEILETVQVDDDQWVVRGAAAEALERRQNPPWKIQPPVEDVAELAWLSDFAAREGLGVAPGKAALEMVRRALNKGTPDEQIAALEAIAWSGGAEFSIELTQALHSDESYIRDAAFEALWQLRAQGEEMPKVAA